MADLHIKIEKLNTPVLGFQFNVRVFKRADGFNKFYYAGIGSFFKTLKEAEDFKKRIMQDAAV